MAGAARIVGDTYFGGVVAPTSYGEQDLGASDNYWGTVYALTLKGAIDTSQITSGTLSVSRGGTGKSSFTANSVIMSGTGTTSALTTRAVADSSSASAISTNNYIVTERDIYYGLPTINNSHTYTNSTTIYAPTSGGTKNQILVSTGSTAIPTWKATANGAAYATSDNGELTFGTLPIAQGGTGATTAAGIRENLGLSNAMHFIGTTTTTMSDGLTTANVTVNSTTHTPVAGDVVLYSDTEYVWTGSAWERLGRDSSFKTTQTAVTKPTAATNKWVSAIGQNANGVIDVSYTTLDTSGDWSGLASKATADSSGNNIINTYLTKAAGVTNVAYNTTDKKITKTINGTTSDVVSIATLKTDMALDKVENTALSTWAGTANITTVGTISTGTWSGTAITANKGGTGQTSYTIGDILYASSTSALSKLGGNTTTTRKFLRSVATTSGTAVAPVWDTVTATDVGLSDVTNTAALNKNTGAKGDIIYWSAKDTPAHLTNTSSTTKNFLSITSQVPAWTTLSKSDVGLGNVENTALSTWAGSNKITTVGTITSGTWQGNDIGASYLPTASTSALGIMKVGTGLSVSSGTVSVSYGTSASTALQGNATLVTLNGTNKNASSVASFYAPTSAGTSGQYLKSSGSGAPTWANLPTLSATSSGSGNVVTAISASNHAITYTLGTISTISAQIIRW